MSNRDYTEQAETFCKAIKLLAEREDALENFELYLSYHFETWLQKRANTPERISEELMDFANIYDLPEII